MSKQSSFKFLCSTIILIFSITFLFPIKTFAAELSSTPIYYVALGDSIATGTILGSSKIDSHVKYFAKYLQTTTTGAVTVKNLAHDGDRSVHLLNLLNTNSTVQNEVAKADVITVSIGGNNLMYATNIPGFSKIDTAKAEAGVVAFSNEWPQIIAKLKLLNTKSTLQIIVNTQYNPFNTIALSGYKNDPALHIQVDGYLNRINGTITSNTSLGYVVADVATTFHPYATVGKMGSLTYFYPLFSYLRNPHPNITGQNEIAKVISSKYIP